MYISLWKCWSYSFIVLRGKQMYKIYSGWKDETEGGNICSGQDSDMQGHLFDKKPMFIIS